MLQDTVWIAEVDSERDEATGEAENIRSILAASSCLPPAVISAELSRTYDRVLGGELLEALTNPSVCPQNDAVERCARRKRALAPYFGKRLVCVLVNLPGVMYTIEIDPYSEQVIHWEYLER